MLDEWIAVERAALARAERVGARGVRGADDCAGLVEVWAVADVGLWSAKGSDVDQLVAVSAWRMRQGGTDGRQAAQRDRESGQTKVLGGEREMRHVCSLRSFGGDDEHRMSGAAGLTSGDTLARRRGLP